VGTIGTVLRTDSDGDIFVNFGFELNAERFVPRRMFDQIEAVTDAAPAFGASASGFGSSPASSTAAPAPSFGAFGQRATAAPGGSFGSAVPGTSVSIPRGNSATHIIFFKVATIFLLVGSLNFPSLFSVSFRLSRFHATALSVQLVHLASSSPLVLGLRSDRSCAW
jgi:hypothetical protein